MYITTKDAPAALGLNKNVSPEQLMRKLVRAEKGLPPENNAAQIIIDYINAHEPLAQMDFLAASGELVEKFNAEIYRGYLSSRPLAAGENIVLIKTPFELRNSKKPVFKSIEEQPDCYAQIQLDMLINDHKHAYFYQWAPCGYKIEVVEINDNYIFDALEKLDKFFSKIYTELDNPDHLKAEFKEINSLIALDLIHKYDNLSAKIEDDTAQKNQVLEDIIKLCDNKPALINGRKLSEIERLGNVDYKLIPELKDIKLDKYRKKSSKYWRLV